VGAVGLVVDLEAHDGAPGDIERAEVFEGFRWLRRLVAALLWQGLSGRRGVFMGLASKYGTAEAGFGLARVWPMKLGGPRRRRGPLPCCRPSSRRSHLARIAGSFFGLRGAVFVGGREEGGEDAVGHLYSGGELFSG